MAWRQEMCMLPCGKIVELAQYIGYIRYRESSEEAFKMGKENPENAWSTEILHTAISTTHKNSTSNTNQADAAL